MRAPISKPSSREHHPYFMDTRVYAHNCESACPRAEGMRGFAIIIDHTSVFQRFHARSIGDETRRFSNSRSNKSCDQKGFRRNIRRVDIRSNLSCSLVIHCTALLKIIILSLLLASYLAFRAQFRRHNLQKHEQGIL